MQAAISQWFWAICILTLIVNGAFAWLRACKVYKDRPEERSRYMTVIKGYIAWPSIPWLAMGIGIMTGGVPSFYHFARVRDANPFVISFYICAFLLWVIGTHWVFARGGAELLAKYPVAITFVTTSRVVKIMWIFCFLAFLIGVLLLFVNEIPIPE